MKRSIVVLLCTVVMMMTTLFGTAVLPAFAAGTGSITLQAGSAKRGDQVGIGLVLAGNPGSMATLKVQIEYSSGLEFLGATPSADVFPSSTLTTSQTLNTYPYTLLWVDGLVDRTNSGMLATLNFRVKNDCPIESQTVTVRFVESFDFSGGTNTFSSVTNYINVSCSHPTWSKWEMYDTIEGGSGHHRYCSVCGKEEKADHTFPSLHEPLYPATCRDDGLEFAYCTVCGAIKYYDIPATGNHSYGQWTGVDEKTHAHTCEICGKTETVSHSYVKTWSADGTKHWHECSVCGTKKDLAEHVPGAEATETAPQVCTVCGKILQPALGHMHNWSGTWESDKETHWHSCPGCSEKSGIAKHVFDNDSDEECNVCGYKREIVLAPVLKSEKDVSESKAELSESANESDPSESATEAEPSESNGETEPVESDQESVPAESDRETEPAESVKEDEASEPDETVEPDKATEPAKPGETDSKETTETNSVIPWIIGGVLGAVLLAGLMIFLINRGKKSKKT